MTATTTVPEITEFPLFNKGKVRDVYDLDDKLLIVASDRISAYDVVLPCLIPRKGEILTQISLFWFNKFDMPNHIISSNVDEYPESLHKHKSYLQGRSMLVKKAKRIDIECVARGYLVGSGWEDYQKTGTICGHKLPEGLQMASKLEPPLFTPSLKNDTGHDENVSYERMCEVAGDETGNTLKNMTLDLYSQAREYALTKDVIIADTKFEFGEVDGKIILIDEILTPDSSRFWPASEYKVGQEQPSYDKQYLRNYLSGLDWDKTYPGPSLPDEIVEKSLDKYKEAYKQLIGKDFE
ncbi:MAG: phosphoribosylaminoimidazolesuccinocarboxamide synthase [Fibrobacteria bacterium]|nr:phosphoribosylaminoimidazolesuccinocarboxamide synthase [Fibrobacteria bacterium]